MSFNHEKVAYLLSLVAASMLDTTCIQCTSPKQKGEKFSAEELNCLVNFHSDYVRRNNRRWMYIVSSNGDLISQLNFADITQPCLSWMHHQKWRWLKWMDVLIKKPGWVWMGIAPLMKRVICLFATIMLEWLEYRIKDALSSKFETTI